MNNIPVTPAKAGVHKLSLNQVSTDVLPQRVFRFDGVDFPFALPGFDGFLASDSIADVIEHFKIDEGLDVIFFGETVDDTLFMLEDSSRKIAGDAHIQRPIIFAGHDINVTTFAHQANPSDQCVWMPAYAGMTGKEREARHG